VAQTDLSRRELLLVDPLEGSDLLFELLSSRAKDERQGTYVVSILRNVTDLWRARQELEENYRRLSEAEAQMRTERNRLDLVVDSVAAFFGIETVNSSPSGLIVSHSVNASAVFWACAESGSAISRRIPSAKCKRRKYMSLPPF